MLKKILFTIAIIATSISFAQTKDYNLKKGYIAEGYDVVSYFNNKPTEGKKEFTYEYDGVKFKFANQENLKKFKKTPKKYIPQYGGWCAYAIGANNKKYGINPKTYELKDGKLYLFYNKFGVNTLKKWTKKDPEKLRAQANANWQQYK